MKISDWLTVTSMIVAIAIMLVAPWYMEWFTSRKTHPKPNPDTVKPKNLKRRISGLLKALMRSPRIAFVLVILGFLSAAYDYHHTPLVSKRFVFDIGFAILLIVYGLVLNVVLNLVAITRAQYEEIDELRLSISKKPKNPHQDSN